MPEPIIIPKLCPIFSILIFPQALNRKRPAHELLESPSFTEDALMESLE